MPVVEHAIRIAADRGVKVILNPAPAISVAPALYGLVDYITPKESEAAALAGVPIESIDDASRAADFFLRHGARNLLVTLGAPGVLVKTAKLCRHIPAIEAGAAI